MTGLLYTFLWHLLHFMCSTYEILLSAYCSILKQFAELKSLFAVQLSDVEYISLHIPKLDKVPNHLTVLLGQEQLSYTDLAKFVVWCLAADINYISFYDISGVLKENFSQLQACVASRKHRDHHIFWHTSGRENYENGITGQKIHVKALSAIDGRENIAKVTRQIAENNTSPDLITIDSVNKELQKEYEFPDPDLAVYCTNVFTIAGYPPWQIRLTEFLKFGNHKNASHIDFVDILYKYSKCEQRKGK